MNTVFLIGNGFDKAQGLKTGYDNFRDYYKALESSNQEQDILDFIARVEREELADEKWSDLEIALGRYTDVFKGKNMVDDAITFHDKLSVAIFTYLEQQSLSLTETDDLRDQFRRYLFMPEADGRFNPDETTALRSFNKYWENAEPWSVRLITFNYTDSIERTCNFSKDLKLGERYSRNVLFRAMEHIHGYHKNRQILGVNDESQIANEALRGTDAMDWYVKSQNNNSNGIGCQRKCLGWIASANLMCVFGMSYGPTDMIWWQAVVDRLLAEPKVRLLLFVCDKKNNFNTNQDPHKNRFKQQEKLRFIKASAKNLTQDQIRTVMKKIFVGYNTNLFSYTEKLIVTNNS